MSVKRRSVWLSLAIVTSLVFIITSCSSPSSVTDKTTTPSGGATTTTKFAEKTTTTAATAKPQYGGTFAGFMPFDTSLWDPCQGFDLMGWQISIGNEALMSGDWSKGPAGTGETDWLSSLVGNSRLAGGLLAESWEVPDNEHVVFHIRKGVKWLNKAPANGREFTAEDVAWNINKQWSIPNGNFQNFFTKNEWLIEAKATDKYTVELTVPVNSQGVHFWEDGQRCYMMLPEAFPNQKDWKNALGTGPFTVTDYVPASSMTFKKNPDYWQTNPVGPGKGDKLPYIDGMTLYIIPDTYTQQASFRTGKIDILSGVVWEDWQNLVDTMPYKPEYVQTYGDNPLPQGRQDKQNLPFKDVKVRQAMNYAVDKQSILKDYYQGHAALLGWPYYNTPAYADLYTPLEEMPADVQAIVKGGDVEKAKQLLTEAGYPTGFKTTIYASNSQQSDYLSVIKAQLAQANIDMEIKQVDPGVFSSMERGRTWEEMWYHGSKQWFLTQYMFEMRPDTNDCGSFWSSPETDKVYADIKKYMAIDDKVWRKELKDVTPFILQQSFAIWLPVAYKYNMWQPWVQNFYGCTNMSAFQPFHAQEYTWIDQAKKSSLGK